MRLAMGRLDGGAGYRVGQVARQSSSDRMSMQKEGFVKILQAPLNQG
jgi:hypothetical protein